MRNRQISAISWGQKLHRISNGWRCTLCPRAFFGANLSRVHFRWTSAEALSLEGFRFHIDFTKMVGTGISKWNTERLFSVHVTSLRRRNWTAQADLPIPNTTVDGWYPMPVDSYLIVYGLFCVYMYMYTYIYMPSGTGIRQHQQYFVTQTFWKSKWFSTISMEIKIPQRLQILHSNDKLVLWLYIKDGMIVLRV